MATPTLSRATPASPRTILKVPTTSTITTPKKSILKSARPAPPSPSISHPHPQVHPQPLSPSPFPFSASFLSIYLTPTTSPISAIREMKSPHVRFPPSPALVSTYGFTHSPNTYDRAPISVSPNPLAMPSWGDRVYSPTIDGFRLCVDPSGGDTSEDDGEASSPSLFGMLRLNAGGGGSSSPTPAQLEFEFGVLEDPRSPRGNIPLPRITVDPSTTSSPPQKGPNSKSRSKPKLTLPLTASRPAPPPPSSSPPRPIRNKNRPSSIKFANPLPFRPHNPTTSLSKSLITYPRSPYPSAPLGSPTLSPCSPSPVLPRPDDVPVPVSPSDTDFVVNGELEALRRKVTNLNQGQNQGKNRGALSLDDKMCRRGMRGTRGRGRAQVGQLRLGVPGSTSSGSGPVVKSPIRFVPMPSPLRMEFDFVIEEDEGVSSPVDEYGTATSTVATTGRKKPPPLSLNDAPAPAFVTTTTTTVTTTTVQITSSPITQDNTKADIHNTVNTKTNANTNTITYSHTPTTSLLPSPPPYSETPLGAEVTLGPTPSASAFGAGFRSGAHHNSESPSHNHTQHIHPCQHEWKGSESARLNMAFWESMSLAGAKVTTNGLKRVDGDSRAMTSSTCDLMREERKEVEEEPAGIVCGRPGTYNSTASWVSVLGEGRGSENPYDVNVKAGSDSGNCFVDEGICMAGRGRPSVGGTAVSSLSESTPDILSRSTSSSSFRRQELSLFPLSARRAQRQQEQEKQKDCSKFDSENRMEGQELNMVFATRDGVLWSPGLAHRRYRHSSTSIQKQLEGPDDDNRRSISFRAWQHMPREGEDENGCGRKTTSSSPHFIDANSTLVTPIPPPTNPKAKSKSELKSGSGEKPRRARGNLNLRSTESEVEDEYDNDDEEDVGVTVDLKGLKSPGRTNSFASSRRGVERISRGKPGDVRMKTVEAEGTRISRLIVASPSPNDPTVMFPSFSFALSQNQSQSQSQDGQEQLVGLGVVDAVPEEDSIAKMTLGANTGGGGGDVTSNWQREEFAHVGGSFPLPKLTFPPRARLSMFAGDRIPSSLQSNYRSNGDERQRM